MRKRGAGWARRIARKWSAEFTAEGRLSRGSRSSTGRDERWSPKAQEIVQVRRLWKERPC
jgi:hypothetical protein